MTVKEYFEQAITLQTKLTRQTLACKLLQQEAESISSPGFDPHYGTGAKQAPYVAKVEKLEKEEARRKALGEQLEALHTQMEEVIEQVDRPDWQALLRTKYINGASIRDCSKDLYVSRASVCRFLQNAMKQISLPPDAIDLRANMKWEKRMSA